MLFLFASPVDCSFKALYTCQKQSVLFARSQSLFAEKVNYDEYIICGGTMEPRVLSISFFSSAAIVSCTAHF